MTNFRIVIALALLSFASAHDGSSRSPFKALYEKAAKLWRWASGVGKGHWPHKHHAHGKIQKMMREAHVCHEQCGADVECHAKCPKPMAAFAKACHDLPAIKKCHETCKGADCETCPKFDLVWMEKKFAKHPGVVSKMAEKKCPMVEKAVACHSSCKPGDFECHQKCPEMFRRHHGKPFARKFHHKFHHMMEKVHGCHEKCEADAACHGKCLKPWEPFAKTCQHLPVIKECLEKCKGSECEKCDKLDLPFLDKQFAMRAASVAKMAAEKCQMIAKIGACHEACEAVGRQCHHKCPSMFDSHCNHDHHDEHHSWHHDDDDYGDHDRDMNGHDDNDHDEDDHEQDMDDHDEEDDNGDNDYDHNEWQQPSWHRNARREWHHDEHEGKGWHKAAKMMERAHSCHWQCGKDAECHDKCLKPLAVSAKMCKEFASILDCHKKCKDYECDKCEKFDAPWMQEKFEKYPDRFAKMAEAKCGLIEEAHACHNACKHGDFECHQKCPEPRSYSHRDTYDSEKDEPYRGEDILV